MSSRKRPVKLRLRRPSLEILRTTNGPEGFFSRASRFIITHSPMTVVQGEGNPSTTAHIMNFLSQHIIHGATYNSAARSPQPGCHPGTRVGPMTRINSWLDGQTQPELVLRLNGCSGVGKTTLTQKVAEDLAESDSLGASVFISKPDGRNDPNRIFITIAYYLATKIEAYRNFVVDRLIRDPDLLNASMAAQFATFIIEPVRKKIIGAGEKRWTILLDGLNELEGADAQCDIIRLISGLARNHPNASLLWMISSRPEQHISNTFNEDEVRQSLWEEHLLIDSAESREDVGRFLQFSFETTQRKFAHFLPSNWPNNTAILQLKAAAAGYFLIAVSAMQFINDPNQHNPDSQLHILLSTIDGSNECLGPFVRLDSFYSAFFSRHLWPRTKLLLGFVIRWRQYSALIPNGFNTLRGVSIFFNITVAEIYGCLKECVSILYIPEWGVAHQENLAFLHESLVNFLLDPRRSGDFHINVRDPEDDMAVGLFDIWDKCSGDSIATVSVEPAWHKYCSKRDGETPRTTPSALRIFHSKLFYDLVHCLTRLVIDNLAGPGVTSLIHEQLRKIHFSKLCYYLNPHDFLNLALALLANYSRELVEEGLAREIPLKDLTFSHLDWKGTRPARAHIQQEDGETFKCILHRPRSSRELLSFISGLRSIQERWRDIRAFIYGKVPKGRIAVFRSPLNTAAWLDEHFMYYIIPYPC